MESNGQDQLKLTEVVIRDDLSLGESRGTVS